MTKEVRRRAGTTAEHSTFTGAPAELTIDETKDTVVVHDGSTVAGFPLAKEDLSNVADADIKTAYEANSNTNPFTDADQTKLSGIETSATVDQTDGEIKTAYENNANTNAFTDTNVTELAGALQRGGGTMTGTLILNTDPTGALEASTKQYVDGVATGLDTKSSARAATTANITLSAPQTIDGISVVADDRVLVKDQTDVTENGIYDVKAGAWVRSFDADNTPGAELGPGAFIFVEEGTISADSGFVAVGTPTGSGALDGFFDLGVDDIDWSQFSGAGQITAGINLNKDGNTINLDTTLVNFQSTGIDDNATTTAITISVNERVSINRTSSIFATMDVTGIDNNVMRLTASSPRLYWETASGTHFNYKISAQDTSSALEISAGTAASSSAPTDSYTQLMVLRGVDQKVGIGTGTTIPDGKLHIMKASAGSITASGDANTLILEDTGTHGLSILTDAGGRSEIRFGDPTNGNSVGQVRYQHSNNRMFFHVNNANAMSIHSGGNVGIGTVNNSPLGKLNVVQTDSGVIAANSLSTTLVLENNLQAGVSILTPNDQIGSIYFGDPEDNDIGQIKYDHTNDAMLFHTNASEAMRIDSNGDLGIGTTNPGAHLHVLDNSASITARIDSNQNADVTVLRFGNSSLLSSARMRIQWNDNVGNSYLIHSGSGVADNGGFGPSGITLQNTSASGIRFVASNASGDMKFFTAGTGNANERMIIDSTGKVGIGQDTPLSPLHVEDNSISIITRSQTDQNLDVKTYFSSNPNAGAAAAQTLELNNSGNGLQLSYYGTGFTSSGSKRQSGGRLQNNGVGGMSIVAEHVSGDIRMYTGGAADANERITIIQNGRIGFGEPDPDATLHIKSGDAGAFSANADADDLIIENSANVGIQLVCPSANAASIHFGRNDDPDRGKLVYAISDNTMRFTVNTVEHLTLYNTGATGIGKTTPIAALDIDSNAAIGTNNAIRINAAAPAIFWESESASFHNYKVSAQDGTSQTWQVFASDAVGADALSGSYTPLITVAGATKRVGINQSSPEGQLHVQSATAGAVVVNGNADELVIEGGGQTGMSFLSPAGNSQNIFFGDVDDNDIGQLKYDHGDNSMRFVTNTVERMRIFGSGDVAIGDIPGTPIATLHVQDASTNVIAGFYRDTDFGDSTQDVVIELGNSGTNQGKLRISYFNNTVAANQVAKIDFLPRNTDNDGQKQGGQIVFSNDPDTSGEIRLGAVDNESNLNFVALDGDDFVWAPVISGKFSLGRTAKRWKTLWLDSTSSSAAAATMLTSSSGYSGAILKTETNTVAGSGFNHILCNSDVDGTIDPVFRVQGNGLTFADGAYSSAGADYADYFEWADGNPENQDRVGYSVVFNSEGKISIAVSGEYPIGIVSGNPASIGGAAANKWDNKYLKDDFDRYVLDNGERMLNPEFNPDMEYIPRGDRPEWDAIGLVGRLPLRNGQVVSETWLKIRDISATVEEWLVK